MAGLVSVLGHSWWYDRPLLITVSNCCQLRRGRWRGQRCDPEAPDPDHGHRWDDLRRLRLARARKLRTIHSLCGCPRCCGHSRFRSYRDLTRHERQDRVRVREQIEEAGVKTDCIAAPRLRGRT